MSPAERTWIVAVGMALALATLAPQAEAWDDAGHQVVAAIAWEQMTPEARRRAAELLRLHPRAPSWSSIWILRWGSVGVFRRIIMRVQTSTASR